jgi:hypothetical protein
MVLGVTAEPVRHTNCEYEAVSTVQAAPHTATSFAPAEMGKEPKRVSNKWLRQVSATSGKTKHPRKF